MSTVTEEIKEVKKDAPKDSKETKESKKESKSQTKKTEKKTRDEENKLNEQIDKILAEKDKIVEKERAELLVAAKKDAEEARALVIEMFKKTIESQSAIAKLASELVVWYNTKSHEVKLIPGLEVMTKLHIPSETDKLVHKISAWKEELELIESVPIEWWMEKKEYMKELIVEEERTKAFSLKKENTMRALAIDPKCGLTWSISDEHQLNKRITELKDRKKDLATEQEYKKKAELEQRRSVEKQKILAEKAKKEKEEKKDEVTIKEETIEEIKME